jgi:hypothetical protein
MSLRAGSFFIAAVLFGLTASGVARADDKCKIATKPGTPTAEACAKGGIPAAKKLMKDMVKKAKDKGQKGFTCDGCHKDLDSYALTEHAEDDYKKLEAAIK